MVGAYVSLQGATVKAVGYVCSAAGTLQAVMGKHMRLRVVDVSRIVSILTNCSMGGHAKVYVKKALARRAQGSRLR